MLISPKKGGGGDGWKRKEDRWEIIIIYANSRYALQVIVSRGE